MPGEEAAFGPQQQPVQRQPEQAGPQGRGEDQGGVARAGVRLGELLPFLFLRRLACEWPSRLVTPPFSRALETRLSSADLALLLLRLPWTPARAWLENTLELLSTAHNPLATESD